jgi:hypothetical protein
LNTRNRIPSAKTHTANVIDLLGLLFFAIYKF